MAILNDEDMLIREFFDLSHDRTRKTIVALEDGEREQLLTTLTSSLYDKMVSKVDKIDFGTIPQSKGDITRVEGFDNTMECLNIIKQIVTEYRENTEVVDNVITAVNNLKDRKGLFTKSFSMGMEFPIMTYNLIVLAIEQSVTFLISVCIQYIKDPETKDIKMSLDQVAYNNTKSNLIYEQLVAFNNSCANKDLDRAIEEILSKKPVSAKEAEEFDIDGGSTVIINVGPNSKVKTNSPFQKFDDGEDVSNKEVLHDDLDKVQHEISGFAVGAMIAASIPLAVKVIKFLAKVLIPLLRRITYFFINSKVKFKDMLITQGELIEANAYKLKYSSTEDKRNKDKIAKKQLAVAEKLKAFGNKITIDNNTSSKKVNDNIKSENKKYKIDDLEDNLSPEVSSKSALF